MIALAGQPATYDIKLTGDADGSVDLVQLYEIFAPPEAQFLSIYGDILNNINIPGNLSTL
jgi:hypothetical protein